LRSSRGLPPVELIPAREAAALPEGSASCPGRSRRSSVANVIAFARKGEASIFQIARDFGISESCLQRWLKIADREDGLSPPAAGDRSGGEKPDSAELRELRRRNKLLEQENEILRRAAAYVARDVLPE
jgi:transposase